MAAPQMAAPQIAAPQLEATVIQHTSQAARAVLSRGGAESCLRGKLTRVLLELSSSCERNGVRDALCRLADQAVVVTPMSLSFMDQTAQRLLDLIGIEATTGPTPAASAEANEP